MKHISVILALALGVSAWSVQAQDAGGPPPGGDGGGPPQGDAGEPPPDDDGGMPPGGPGGFGDPRGFAGGNFDPAPFQQMMMNNMRDQLGFTNDTDWTSMQPLLQKVLDAHQALGGPGGGFGGPGGFGGRPDGRQQNVSAEQQALQAAIDNNAPVAEIKEALAKYKTVKKSKQVALNVAQENLRQVLSTKQEAQATLMGLLPN